MNAANSWKPVIGLEVHARLETATKLFCGCELSFAAPPNQRVCPVCLGLPGALPVLNAEAVRLALLAAIATNCRIALESRFARKHYFYPDLPKGYQITQFDRPLAVDGSLNVGTTEARTSVRIQRIHLEEDAGKLLHETPWSDVPSNVSLIDFNRAGAPLIEIVSHPDLTTPEEAAGWLARLRQVLMYCGICDGNMEDGSFRADANVSLHREGEPLGVRVEIKNLNSFRFFSRAISFEIERQASRLSAGETIVQETRLFDSKTGETRPMRSKEEEHDYRYLEEPDLLPLVLQKDEVEALRGALPELPADRVVRWEKTWGVPTADGEVLAATRGLADYFESVALASSPRLAANWVRNEVLRVTGDRSADIAAWSVTPDRLASLLRMVEKGEISGSAAKEIFELLPTDPRTPEALVESLGLAQIHDEGVIRAAAEEVIGQHASQAAAYRAGKQQLLGFFVGQVLKKTGGKANPEITSRIVRELLG
ncbi:MAG TPA: Asp-tRNA(Asn)/Glu-tRNA(Gln) amidotransferase subunit GatB [Thermoanaerobaculia bacterium]|nr:Asp-tRNA(Asn)/Glu-tRNA(Gln) amidotransferase subunit GatB [Thermoanaerobaculia bacterium]